MGDEESVIKSTATSLFVQLEEGKELYYLGLCTDLADLANPRGGSDPIICRDGMGDFKIVSDKRTPPEMISLTIGRLHNRTASWLDKTKCKFTLFALQRCDGNEGSPDSWITGQSVRGVKITNDPITNISQRDADDEMLHSYEANARPPRYDLWEMLASQKAAISAEDANCITACDTPSCAEGCGSIIINPCTTIFVGLDAAGAATANVLISQDGGNTWAICAADPFAINLNITALRCYKLTANTLRLIALRMTLAATPLQASYSDDLGVTWSPVVDLGVTAAEAVNSPNAFFIYSGTSMWVGTSGGRIYYSDDGALTWVNQTSALTASGGNALNGVSFLSANFGVAVGAADTVIYTIDGGTNWAAAVATGSAAVLTDVEVFSRTRWLVTAANGYTYMTYDGGLTWVRLPNFAGAGAGTCKSLSFSDVLNGFMVHQTAGGVGRIFRTINGGYSWVLTEPVHPAAGLHEVMACDNNHCFAVGDDDGTQPVILEAGII